MIFHTAEKVKSVCEKHHLPFIFKSSYKKANRTSMSGFVSIGMDEALRILDEVKKQFSCPVLTDSPISMKRKGGTLLRRSSKSTASRREVHHQIEFTGDYKSSIVSWNQQNAELIAYIC